MRLKLIDVHIYRWRLQFFLVKSFQQTTSNKRAHIAIQVLMDFIKRFWYKSKFNASFIL